MKSEINQIVASDNYDRFQHLSLAFLQKFVSPILRTI
jgi:hypothetical protein